MACGVCGGLGHDVHQCPHKRVPARFTGGAKDKRCGCCGRYRPDVERHDTLGQGNDSDLLDLCLDCHLLCCHDGDCHNAGRKPRACRISGQKSHWCQ